MKLILVLFLVLLIQNISARQNPKRQSNRNYKKYAHTPSLSKHHKPAHELQAQQQKYYQHHQQQQQQQQTAEENYNDDDSDIINNESSTLVEVEVDILKCPLGCVCQYAHFMDLPISRWINFMQMRQSDKANREETAEELINENEVAYEGDDSFSANPFIKQATCILQEESDPVELVNSLPHDLQALILLYTGIGRNKTVNTSILKPLNQLVTLEIRGSQDLTFRLIFDEPLSFLQHANFESITLLGSDNFKQPKNPVHPSESFDYKPRSELMATYETLDNDAADVEGNGKQQKLGFKKLDDEIEILPYEVYMMEVKKARMPTFYGWEHLEVLRIQACQLNELHWEMFDGLGALEHLSLERNGIEKMPPFALYGAMHIKTLSLAHNNIYDLHYRDLAGLLELEMLDLSDNRLYKLSEMSFPPFPKLVRVDFRNNPIKYIFPATFWVMNGTSEMFFGSREVPMELWGNMPFESLSQLRELSIGNVSINNLEHNVFKGLTSLEKLLVRGKITNIEFDAFAGLRELRELDLSNCQISEISMDALMGCKNLEIINLSKNNISYIPPGLFDDQTVLEEIYLNGNNLGALPATFFLQPRLHVAHLSDNPWKCSCEMSNWRPKITNQERAGTRQKRCIRDYQTGEQIACRRVDNFKFNHRLAPRCSNYNERSVFYVLRKQLQCGPGRLAHAKRRGGGGTDKQRMPKMRKMEERHQMHNEKLQQKQQQQRQQNLSKERIDDSTATRSTGLLWQIQREEKIRRTLAQQNTLDFILQQEQRKLAQRIAQQKAAEKTESGQEISNEIEI